MRSLRKYVWRKASLENSGPNILAPNHEVSSHPLSRHCATFVFCVMQSYSYLGLFH